jgi:hypothetical protein
MDIMRNAIGFQIGIFLSDTICLTSVILIFIIKTAQVETFGVKYVT